MSEINKDDLKKAIADRLKQQNGTDSKNSPTNGGKDSVMREIGSQVAQLSSIMPSGEELALKIRLQRLESLANDVSKKSWDA